MKSMYTSTEWWRQVFLYCMFWVAGLIAGVQTF